MSPRGRHPCDGEEQVVNIDDSERARRYGCDYAAPWTTLAGERRHLVTIAGNGGCTIFLNNADRELFLDLLDDVVARYEWGLYAWCLLGNHAHLVASAEATHLAGGMQRLKGLYAVHFHRRHHTSGHLFKRPYDSRPSPPWSTSTVPRPGAGESLE